MYIIFDSDPKNTVSISVIRLKNDSHRAAQLGINRRACGKTTETDFAPLFREEQEKNIKTPEVEEQDKSDTSQDSDEEDDAPNVTYII